MKSFSAGGQKILHLGNYHAYRRGSNPNFDTFSGECLDLKDNRKDAVKKFAKHLEPYIAGLTSDVVLTYVPSHKVGKSKGGLSGLIKAIARENDVAVPELLERTKTIDKLATGGDRSLEVQMGSMRVSNRAAVSGKVIVVIDDITTTGHSLLAARKLMLAANAKRVILMAMGRTMS